MLVFSVKADGTYDVELENVYQINNDEGRREHALERVRFDPEVSTAKVLSAETLGQPGRTPQSPNVKAGQSPFPSTKIDVSKLKATPVAGTDKNGQRHFWEITIPFENLQVYSNIRYKVAMSGTKPLIPGVFSEGFSWGANRFEWHSDAVIRSMKPLFYKANAFAKTHVKIEESRDGMFYVLRLTQLVPIGFSPSEDEISVDADSAPIPRVDVTTATSWSEIVIPIAKEFERVLAQDLPPEYAQIVAIARKQSTDEAKIGSVLDSLITRMTYAGDWRSVAGKFFPRDLKATAKTATGDCKDFATATTAMLRKLGFQADVALVRRGPANGTLGGEPVEDEKGALPTLNYFNHAIVKVKLANGESRWIDPTNDVILTKSIYTDIAHSPALVLRSDTVAMERTSRLSQFKASSLIERTIRVRPDQSAGYTIQLKTNGAEVATFKQALRTQGPDPVNQLLRLAMTGNPADQPGAKLSYDRSSRFADQFDATLEFSGRAPIQEGKDGSRYLLAPFPFGLQYILKIASVDGRQTGVFLGSPGESVEIDHVFGAEPTDEVAGDCSVYSEWLDIERRVTKVKDGFDIHTTYKTKTESIPQQAIFGKPFKEMLGYAIDCAGSSYIRVGKPTKSNEAPTLVDIDLEKATLEDGIAIAKMSGPERLHYRNLKAIRIFEKILQREPGNAKARAWLGSTIKELGFSSGTKYSIGYVSEGLKHLTAAATTDPQDPVVCRLRAGIYLALDDILRARQDFAVAYAKEPKDYLTLRMGARISEAEGDVNSAEKWLFAMYAAAVTPQEKERVYGHLGILYLDARRYDRAINAFTSALALKSDAWNWHNLAIAYHESQRNDEAIASSRKALAIASFGAGRSMLVTGLTAKAQLLLWEEKNYYLRIKTPHAEADGKLAETLITEALTLDPDNLLAIRLAGDLQFQKALKGDAEGIRRAKEYYGRYVDRGTADPYVLAAFERVSYSPEAPVGDFHSRVVALERHLATLEPMPQPWTDIKGQVHMLSFSLHTIAMRQHAKSQKLPQKTDKPPVERQPAAAQPAANTPSGTYGQVGE